MGCYYIKSKIVDAHVPLRRTWHRMEQQTDWDDLGDNQSSLSSAGTGAGMLQRIEESNLEDPGAPIGGRPQPPPGLGRSESNSTLGTQATDLAKGGGGIARPEGFDAIRVPDPDAGKEGSVLVQTVEAGASAAEVAPRFVMDG